jgi:hypothetical protein
LPFFSVLPFDKYILNNGRVFAGDNVDPSFSGEVVNNGKHIFIPSQRFRQWSGKIDVDQF